MGLQSRLEPRLLGCAGLLNQVSSSVRVYACVQRAALVAQIVKNLPAMQETRVQSLDPEEPLGKRMATRSSIFAWRIPRILEPGGLHSMGLKRVGRD